MRRPLLLSAATNLFPPSHLVRMSGLLLEGENSDGTPMLASVSIYHIFSFSLTFDNNNSIDNLCGPREFTP